MKLKTNFSKLLAVAAITAVASFSVTAFAAMGESDIEPYLKKQGCFKCHDIVKAKKRALIQESLGKIQGQA
jgi:cytochrome c